jgi:hypothetical protein
LGIGSGWVIVRERWSFRSITRNISNNMAILVDKDAPSVARCNAIEVGMDITALGVVES